MPLTPTFEMADLTSSAASAAASSTCAPAPRADTPACTGAPLWVPEGPLCGLWPAERAGSSTSADASSPAFDWAELACRNHAMLEDNARAAACAALLLPVRSARRTRTRAACSAGALVALHPGLI